MEKIFSKVANKILDIKLSEKEITLINDKPEYKLDGIQHMRPISASFITYFDDMPVCTIKCL